MKYEIKAIKCLAKFLMIGITLVVLNGCQRYSCWLKTVFNQGNTTILSLKIAQSHIRSLRIYDQANTLCNIDVLFFSNNVSTALNKIASSLGTHNISQKQDKYIIFYLLSPLVSGLLTDSASQWHVLLEIDGTMFNPVELKSTVFSNELKLIFGDLFNRYKQGYIVRFNAIDTQGNNLLHSAHIVRLHFRRLGKHGHVTWNASDEIDPFNKNRLAYDIARV